MKKSWESDEKGWWCPIRKDFGEIAPDVEIMRAGTHTSGAGDRVTFTD